MVSFTRSKAVLELGRRLAAQLDADDDLLSSWMAHYVAQLIEAAEKVPVEDAAQEACAKAIMELWRYRATFPERHRPFAELQPIMRTLASLDPTSGDHRYHAQVLREAEVANADDDAKRLLKFAVGVDFVARVLIGTAIRSAAHRAASAAEPWVELAALAGAEEGVETPIVEFARGGDETGEADGDLRVAALNDTLSRLDTFVELALALAKDLRAQLGAENVGDE
jgi:hypothetical protein